MSRFIVTDRDSKWWQFFFCNSIAPPPRRAAAAAAAKSKQQTASQTTPPSGKNKRKTTTFFPDRQLWEWIGPSFKKASKGKGRKEFYKAIQRGQEIIRVSYPQMALMMGIFTPKFYFSI